MRNDLEQIQDELVVETYVGFAFDSVSCLFEVALL